MTNLERITNLKLQILKIQQELVDNKPSRCTYEDMEDISDNYQSNLEYNYYREEQQALISDIKEEIVGLEKLPENNQYDNVEDYIEDESYYD